MKTRLVIAFILGVVLSTAQAQIPQIINYQGRVAVNGTNFDGTGSFQFALVDGAGTTTYWSNGNGVVSLPVTAGMYSVALGDTNISNMTYPISPVVFANPDVRLRVRFNDGVHGSQQLTPDQRIVSAGYALVADRVIGGTIPNMQVFNTNGTFTVPAGVTRIMVEVWGGGGAGGGTNECCPYPSYPSGGGGGGGYGRSILVVTPGINYTVTIGAGGNGGAPPPQDGGDSSFGNAIAATGGKCGSTGGQTGGDGGTSTAQFSIAGAPGGNGIHVSDNGSVQSRIGGTGGSSGAGGAGGNGGGIGEACCSSAAPGITPGGGGGGGASFFNGTGGSGGNGRVVVWW